MQTSEPWPCTPPEPGGGWPAALPLSPVAAGLPLAQALSPPFSRFSSCVPAEASYCYTSPGTEPQDQKRSPRFCVFVMCYLCEKCYKHIRVQHDLAGCVSWVPRLTLLDLQEQIRLANLLLKWNLLVWRGLTAVKI